MNQQRYRAEKDEENELYTSIRVYLPRSLAKALKDESEARALPISRLVCYAIDNEMEAPAPFTYNCEMPMTEFVEGAYVDEGSKIVRFLTKFLHGSGRDSLMLFRRDMGIVDKISFMLGYREATVRNMIGEYDVPKKAKFNYSRDYKYTKLKNFMGDGERAIEDLKKERAIERLQMKLKRLQEGEDDSEGI